MMTRGKDSSRDGAVHAQEAIVRALAEELGHLDTESPTAADLRNQLVEESGRLAFLRAGADAIDVLKQGVGGWDSAAHQRSRVLIVEDDDGTRTALARWLCEEYDVLTARDGEEGFALATLSPPDVIVTDQWMPRVDGMSMVHRLKLEESTSRVPVIFLTGQTAAEGIQAGISAGAVAYLSKPIDLDALEHALGVAMNRCALPSNNATALLGLGLGMQRMRPAACPAPVGPDPSVECVEQRFMLQR